MPVFESNNTVFQAGTIAFAPTSGTWTVTEIAGTAAPAFGPANLVSEPTGSQVFQIAGPVLQQLIVISPLVASTTAAYTRGANYRIVGGNGVAQSAVCAFGIPTVVADLQTVTTAFNYPNLAFGGLVYDESSSGGAPTVSTIIGGSGTIDGNPTAGTMSFSLTFTARRPDGVEFTLGPVTGSVGLQYNANNGGRAGFQGPLTVSNPIYRINGGFFGPQGREAGFVVTGNYDQDANGLNERFVMMGITARR